MTSSASAARVASTCPGRLRGRGRAPPAAPAPHGAVREARLGAAAALPASTPPPPSSGYPGHAARRGRRDVRGRAVREVGCGPYVLCTIGPESRSGFTSARVGAGSPGERRRLADPDASASSSVPPVGTE